MSNITKNVQENMTRYENLLYKTVGKSFLNNYQLWFSIELIIFMIGMIAIGAWGIISNWYENHQILLFGLIAVYLLIGTPIMMGILIPKRYDKGNLHFILYTLVSIPALIRLRKYLNLNNQNEKGFLETLLEYLRSWQYPGPLSANIFKLADKKLSEFAKNNDNQSFFGLYRLLICFGYRRSLFTKKDHYILFAKIEEKLGELMADKRDWDKRCSMFDHLLWEAKTVFAQKVLVPLRNEFLLRFGSEMGKKAMWCNYEESKALSDYLQEVGEALAIFGDYSGQISRELKLEVLPTMQYREMLLVTDTMKFSDYCQKSK